MGERAIEEEDVVKKQVTNLPNLKNLEVVDGRRGSLEGVGE